MSATVEPVYECQKCGATLERKEQGEYLWCERCRWIWTEGFNEGVKRAREIMDDPNTLVDILTKFDEFLPYKVRR